MCVALVFLREKRAVALTWQRRGRVARAAEPQRDKVRHRALPSHRRRSIFGGEVYKLLSSRLCVLLLAAFILFEVGSCIGVGIEQVSGSETEYRRYTTLYAGEITEENAACLLMEKQEIDGIVNQYQAMLSAAREGAISAEEWQAYVLDYARAYERQGAITRVVARLGVLAANESGSVPWLLYDTGWQRLLNKDADLVLIALVVFLSSVIFPIEYRHTAGGAIAPLVSSTKKGRLHVLFAKCGLAAVVALILTLLSQLCALLPLIWREEWILPSAPLSSLALFSVSPDMTIGAYVVLRMLLQLGSMVLFAVSVCLLSCLYRREAFTLLSVGALLLLLRVVALTGLRALRCLDFLNFWTLTPFLQIEGVGAGDVTLYLFTLCAITGALFYLATRRERVAAA